MKISDIAKLQWQKGEEWFEKWYSTELCFTAFYKNANSLVSLFTKHGLSALALNTQWYYEKNSSLLWENGQKEALEKDPLFLTKLVTDSEKYIRNAQKIILKIEKSSSINEATLKEIKRCLLILWCIFLADLGKPLTHYLEKVLKTKKLTAKRREKITNYYCFSFKKPLAFQEEAKNLHKIRLLYRQKVFKKNLAFAKLPSNMQKLLFIHWTKFRYITGLDLDTEPYTVEDFFDKLKKITYKKAVKNSKLSPKIKNLLTKEKLRFLELTNHHIYLDNYAGDLYTKLDFLLAERLCQKFKISFKDLTWYSFEELESLAKNNIKLTPKDLTKRKQFRIIAQIDGEIAFFYDKEPFLKVSKLVKNNPITNITSFPGLIACKGYAKGIVKIVKGIKDIHKVNKGDILVAATTRPDLMIAILRCSAIVTDTGGITSHAAIVSREFNIPCLVGTTIATSVLKDGDLIEVNANKGVVNIVK